MARVAVVIHAGTEGHDNFARAAHGLLYALENSEEGNLAELIFDGAGTRWVGEMEKPDHALHSLYLAVKEKGLIEGVCGYCAGMFQATEPLKQSGLKTISEFKGHPSLAKRVKEGFQVITL